MVKLVDTTDLSSVAQNGRVGSTPTRATNIIYTFIGGWPSGLRRRILVPVCANTTS